VYNAEQDLWVLKPVLAAKIRPNRSLLQLLGLDRALSKLSPEYQRLYMRFHSLLEGMLQYSPTTRIRPAAASSHLFFRPNDREIAVQTDQKDDSDVREDREHASPQAEHESNGLDEQTQHGESMLSKNTRVAKPSTQMSVSP
jgi:serine/threonine protein kinase